MQFFIQNRFPQSSLYRLSLKIVLFDISTPVHLIYLPKQNSTLNHASLLFIEQFASPNSAYNLNRLVKQVKEIDKTQLHAIYIVQDQKTLIVQKKPVLETSYAKKYVDIECRTKIEMQHLYTCHVYKTATTSHEE